MAGVTDRPFRQLCKRLGAGYAVSRDDRRRDPRLWTTAKTIAPRRPRRRTRADLRADRRHRSGDDGRGGALQRRRAARRSSTSTWAARPRRSATSRPARRCCRTSRWSRASSTRWSRARRRAGDAEDPHRLGPRATQCGAHRAPRRRRRHRRRWRCTAARAPQAISGDAEYDTIAAVKQRVAHPGGRQRRHRLAGKGARACCATPAPTR